MSTWGGRRVAELRAAVLAEHGPWCWLCGGPLDLGRPGAIHLDHVQPRADGGTDDPANLRPAHQTCNQTRGRRPPRRRLVPTWNRSRAW